ncbi:MAG: hypothetical protein KF724_04045 [Phycisphaeraceae bacterium]|nr:hypothetical protein [Phycisphaeraceae bacterium]
MGGAPTDDRARQAVILFTAFEPSGDAHAAPVIAALRAADSSLRICAWGGPRMREAGAEIIEESAADGVMGLSSLSRLFAVRREIGRISRWMGQYKVNLHVAVDSPAANFPICKVAHRRLVRSAHLVAPQLWAWGEWRLKKLRRLTSGVLCLLPFEEAWFRARQVPAKFIGHPRINRDLPRFDIDSRRGTLPTGTPRILLLPGSRTSEVSRNLRLLVRSFTDLQDRHRGTVGLICCATDAHARLVRHLVPSLPTGLHVIAGDLDAAIAWCELALTVSGTVSLDLTRQFKPMVGVYKVSLLSRIGAALLLRTPNRLLPNIIAERRVVPEFVPHWGGARAITEAADHLLQDSRRMAQASEDLKRVAARFRGHSPDEEAAKLLLELMDQGTWSAKGEGAAAPASLPDASPTIDPVGAPTDSLGTGAATKRANDPVASASPRRTPGA